MATIPIYWGNQSWDLEDGGRIRPTGLLTPNDPNWISYETDKGQTADLITETHPQFLYRKQLHKQILEDVLRELERFRSDKPSCILTHGGIASGKSSAVEHFFKYSERTQDYLHIDFDVMKRHLPEFKFMRDNRLQNAAAYTHVESAKLAGKAFQKAITARANVIYEGSLVSLDAIKQRIKEMRKKGYEISCISTHVTTAKGLERAAARYQAGGRFVPPEVIDRTYKQCPGTLVALKELVDGIVLIDNEVDNAPSRPVLVVFGSAVKEIDNELYQQYLADVGEGGRLI